MVNSPFEGAGKEAGLRIWRVKEFNVLEEPKQDYGHFFSGDCYLVLDTFLTDGRLRHHIHFWLGKDTTVDEAGSVAMFAAQLDEALGGGPLQFRQPQGSESSEFLRLFPRIKYLAGGYASGFRDAGKGRGSGPVRLYQIKSPNRTCVQVFEVPCAASSLNHGDCFLLEDVGARLLWVWHGSAANIREKTRAIEAASAFKEGTGIKLSVLDDGDNVSGEALAFFRLLGCPQPPGPEDIRPPEADRPPPVLLQPPQLYKVDGGGSSFPQVSSDGCPLPQTLLQPAGQFVLHAAGTVWVWTGQECRGAPPPLQVGDRFLAHRGLAPRTLVKAVKARFEPGLFTTYFADWRQQQQQQGDGSGSNGAAAGGGDGGAPVCTPGHDSFGNPIPGLPGRGTDAQPYNPEEAAAAMVALVAEGEGAGDFSSPSPPSPGSTLRPQTSLEAAMATLTASKVQVWVMTGACRLELPRQEMGHFYDGASYVVLHSYSTSKDPSELRHAVYVWQGRHCAPLEAGAAALLGADLHRGKYPGRSCLVRVEQGLEPGHLVRLFRGGMIVRNGPRPGNLAPGRSPPGTHLYRVKGEAVAAAHAVEVPATACSLSSGDCFVLERVAPVGAPGTAPGSSQAEPVMVWCGRGSSGAEQDVAAAVAAALAGGGGTAVERVEEGQEPDSFWTALGGRGAYPSEPHRVPAASCSSPSNPFSAPSPRLFHLRDCAGRGLKVEVHSVFSQDSLCGDDVMLLDTGEELYVWYGGSCKPLERPRARDVTARYLAASGRSGACAVVEVEAGQEPPFFTCHFAGWDSAPAGPGAAVGRLRTLSLGKQK